MTPVAEVLMAKASESLAAAEADVAAGRMNSASARAYYAMFQAARAAVEASGAATSARRHGTVARQFGLSLVRPGLIDPVHGRNLNKALELRKVGDYDLATPEPDDVRRAVANAAAFLTAISSHLASRPRLDE